jgi:hypothetical protein
MKRFMVRYTVKPDLAAENAKFVSAVFRTLESERQRGVRYAVFTLDDGVTFVHLVEIEDERNGLRELPAFQAFLAGIKDRCAVPPETTTLTKLESYRLFDDLGASLAVIG